MLKLSCKKITFATSLMVVTAMPVSAGFGDLLQSAGGLMDKAAPVLGQSGGSAASLTDGQINAGLKEALSIGAERAVSLLGKPGGFLADDAVRIPLPGVLNKAAKLARSAGQGKYVDAVETTINEAAEAAVPKTLDIVKDTVSNMTLTDVQGILNGGDTAATEFLRSKAGASLEAAIKPIVSQATDQAGATAAYKQLMKKSSGSLGMLGGFMSQDTLDLDQYVTSKTLDGLFLKLAAEEKAIRENPVARSTDLLKQVFGK